MSTAKIIWHAVNVLCDLAIGIIAAKHLWSWNWPMAILIGMWGVDKAVDRVCAAIDTYAEELENK